MTDTIRCPACQLNQYRTEKCRKCKRLFIQPKSKPQVLPVRVMQTKWIGDRIAPGREKSSRRFLELHAAIAELIGKRVVRFRKERGLTQRGLGVRLGVSRTYISKVENQRCQPTIPQVYRIAKGLNIHPARLVESDRELLTRELMGDSFVVKFQGLDREQQGMVLEYAKELAKKR